MHMGWLRPVGRKEEESIWAVDENSGHLAELKSVTGLLQGRGELRRELHRCLRTGRAQRRPKSMAENRGRIPNMVMISERG